MSKTFATLQDQVHQSPKLRRPYLRNIKKLRDGRAVVSFFISFHTHVPLTQIDADIIEEVLSDTDTSHGLTLILDAPGGDGLAAERIIQICRSYSKGDFETIVPTRAKSAATMVCLGSDRILMSPTSELGPIDPQVPMDLGSGPEWVAAHHITKTYDDLLEQAKALSDGRIEPLLQQLQQFNAVKVEQLKAATNLSEDIATLSLSKGMMKGKKKAEIKNAIKLFTDPELTMSHGRGITSTQALECGLAVEEIKVDDPLWKEVWALYMRSKYIVDRTKINKLVETTDNSFSA